MLRLEKDGFTVLKRGRTFKAFEPVLEDMTEEWRGQAFGRFALSYTSHEELAEELAAELASKLGLEPALEPASPFLRTMIGEQGLVFYFAASKG
ncbi:hypothetical protein [Streptococcus sp. DD11]|uniref:hypothetical protein n=1 Tax=Streptococcus sp. DD11 TaxID=1777879 RepID=UPI00100814C5|nr:hypothetical protein [Streptococcus sp. DD11]